MSDPMVIDPNPNWAAQPITVELHIQLAATWSTDPDGSYRAHIPVLDVSAIGSTVEEAARRLLEVATRAAKQRIGIG